MVTLDLGGRSGKALVKGAPVDPNRLPTCSTGPTFSARDESQPSANLLFVG